MPNLISWILVSAIENSKQMLPAKIGAVRGVEGLATSPIFFVFISKFYKARQFLFSVFSFAVARVLAFTEHNYITIEQTLGGWIKV